MRKVLLIIGLLLMSVSVWGQEFIVDEWRPEWPEWIKNRNEITYEQFIFLLLNCPQTILEEKDVDQKLRVYLHKHLYVYKEINEKEFYSLSRSPIFGVYNLVRINKDKLKDYKGEQYPRLRGK